MQIKHSSDLIKSTIALVDLSLMTAAFYLAYWSRFGNFANANEFIWLYYFSAPLIIFLLLRHGVLTGFRYQKLRDIVKSTVVAFLVAGIVSSTVIYLSKTADYSRLLFVNYFAFSAAFILIEKVIVKKIFDSYLQRGGMNIRIAVVGFGPRFDELMAELKERPQWGISPVLVIDPRRGADISDISSSIRDTVIDEVYIVYPRDVAYHEQLDKLLIALEKLGLPVRLALNFDDLRGYYSQQYCSIGSRAGVMLAPHNLDPDQLIIKRAMDVIGSAFGLLALLIMLPIIALAIKRESPGPVFFIQTRVGKGGREFSIYKFRSMYRDAEQRKSELQAHNLHEGPLFKMNNDPRVTRVGQFLRKYSLDEFPQFWNVFKGDMALVGTRPPTLEEVASYEDHHYRRISIRPGLTGLWQVSGRNEVTAFDDVVALDVDYIKNWNLWLDLKIILRTIGVVVLPGRGKGL
ncbi:MAG: sugar transferase [Halioglobus sp.]